MTLFALVLHVLKTVFGFIFLNQFSLCYPSVYIFLYYCVCSVMYFIVHAAFVRIKLMMMIIIF